MVPFANTSGDSDSTSIALLSGMEFFYGQDFLFLALFSVRHKNGLAVVKLSLEWVCEGTMSGSFWVVAGWISLV